MTPAHPTRRAFLQAGVTGLAVSGLHAHALGQPGDATVKNSGGIPLRPLGRTGVQVPILGLGGHHSARHADERDSIRLVQRAVREGVTFLDNSWDYHDGVAEERMGKALAEAKLRDQVFLMTKVCGRTAQEARSNLEDSLRRLRTDHLDLWQFHEINYPGDPGSIFKDGGAIETARRAVEEGKVRFVGFTGHHDPRVHVQMLQQPFEWASVQMPLNVMDSQFQSFQEQVMPILLQRGIAPLAMKTLGGTGSIVKEGGVSIEEALGYVLTLPIACLISGMESEEILDQNLRIVRSFEALPAERMAALEQAVKPLAADGRFEPFKTTNRFDGPVHRRQQAGAAG